MYYISKNFILIIGILVLLLIGDKNLLLILNLFALFYFILEGRIQKQKVTLILLLFIPVVLSGIYGLLLYPLYDVFKDIYYLLNPVLFLVLGLVIAKRVDVRLFFRAIISVGTVFAITHIITVFSSFGISAFNDFRQIRNEVGGGHIITVIALMLCLFSLYVYKLKLFTSRKLTKIFLLLNCLSLLFSGSRTFWVVFLVMVLSLIYPIFRQRPGVLITGMILMIGLLVLFTYYNPENGLARSIRNSITELGTGDYRDISDMNNKYRGWETYESFRTFNSGTSLQIIFGQGAGKMIDLGTYFFLADDYRRYIPILHNGYMYALVKAGIAGIFCYLLYFVYLFRFAAKKLELSHIKKNFQPLFLIGTLISIYVSNIVVSGLYNPSMELLGVICGSLLYYLMNSKNLKSSHQKL